MTELASENMKAVSGSKFINEFRPKPFLPTITGGLVTGLLQVVLTVSYAVLVYGEELTPFVGQGIGYALIGGFILAIVIALFASLPGTVGSNQDVSVAIFSIISTSIVASMPSDSAPEAAFYTVVVTIALTVMLTGIFFLGLGIFKLGGLVRYLPYPVVGGFLAGTGWLLFYGGFSLTVSNAVSDNLLHVSTLIRWLPALLLSVLMLFAVRRFKKNYVLPILIFAAILFFHVTVWVLDIPMADLSSQGWLLETMPSQALLQPVSLDKFELVNWSVIMNQTANIATVLLVCAVALLLNASGLELAAKQDVDLNKELRATGLGNMLSSLSPGFVGFQQISLTVLNFRMKARNRMVGVIAAVIVGLTLTMGGSAISYFPKVIMGSLLMYLGLSFLVEWAYETWFTLPKIDFAIIWLILLVIAATGFLQGVAVGIIAAIIMFVVSYSRTEVVRHELTGNNYQSQVTRPSNQRDILDEKGEQIYILQLQGFIFFGTADRLFNQIKKRLNDDDQPQPRFVVLDFRRVANLDSTGMLSFRKLKDITAVSHTYLIITAPAPEIQHQLQKGGLTASDDLIHYFPTLDSGLEWCEDNLLEQAGVSLNATPPSLEKQLAAILPTASNLSTLMDHLERQEIDSGITILVQGQPPDDLFFIEAGRVTTELNRPNSPALRLETMRDGSVVGEIGFYLGQDRTASVITDEKSILYRLSAEDLKQLEKDNPEAASVLHQIIIRLLAERVNHLVRTVNALEK